MVARVWQSWIRAGVSMGTSLVILAGAVGSEPAGLRVRAGSGFRYELSQSAGEEHLSLLARTASTEDAWLFVGGTWTDIGYREQPKAVSVDSQAVAAACREKAAGVTRVALTPKARPVFYHLHPFHDDPRFVDPPSLQDIHALALLKEQCREIDGEEMVGVIFDGRGKWIFDITPDLESRILHDEHLPRPVKGVLSDYAVSHGYVSSTDTASRFDLDYPLVAWSAILAGGDLSREKRIAAFIEEAGHLGARVTYSPCLRRPDDPSAASGHPWHRAHSPGAGHDVS